MDDPPRGRDPEAGQRWLPPEPPGGPSGVPPSPGSGSPASGGGPPGQAPPRSPPPPVGPPPGSPPGAYAQPGAPLAAPQTLPGDPGNSEAVAALVLGIVAVVMVVPLGFFLVTLPIAVICGVIAIVLGRTGRRKVDRGETRRNRGQAQAGFAMGIIATVLGLIGIVGFVLLILLSEDFQRGFEEGFEQQQRLQSGGIVLVGLAAAVARATFL
jgi:hypothetical protein